MRRLRGPASELRATASIGRQDQCPMWSSHVTTSDHFKVVILPSDARKRDRTEALAKTAGDGKVLCSKGFLTQSAAPNLVC